VLGNILKEMFKRRPAGALTCPLCGFVAARFDPIHPSFQANCERNGFPYWGGEETLNQADYQCPRCGSFDRERLTWLFIEAELRALPSNGKLRVLHVAPEASLAARLARHPIIESVTFDLQRDDVDVRGDLSDMAMFGDGAFGGLVCSHVLEHIPDDRKAMAELHRVLAPGGWGIALVPLYPNDVLDTREDWSKTSDPERWRHFGQGDHVRLYAKADYISRLETAGFLVEQLGARYFGAQTFARCAITAQSVLYIVRKP
jgi:SAM-dependent methyltransferase